MCTCMSWQELKDKLGMADEGAADSTHSPQLHTHGLLQDQLDSKSAEIKELEAEVEDYKAQVRVRWPPVQYLACIYAALTLLTT